MIIAKIPKKYTQKPFENFVFVLSYKKNELEVQYERLHT